MVLQGINICGFPIHGTKSCFSFHARRALYIELEGDGCEKQQIYVKATLQLFWNEKLTRIERWTPAWSTARNSWRPCNPQ